MSTNWGKDAEVDFGVGGNLYCVKDVGFPHVCNVWHKGQRNNGERKHVDIEDARDHYIAAAVAIEGGDVRGLEALLSDESVLHTLKKYEHNSLAPLAGGREDDPLLVVWIKSDAPSEEIGRLIFEKLAPPVAWCEFGSFYHYRDWSGTTAMCIAVEEQNEVAVRILAELYSELLEAPRFSFHESGGGTHESSLPPLAIALRSEPASAIAREILVLAGNDVEALLSSRWEDSWWSTNGGDPEDDDLNEGTCADLVAHESRLT